MFCGNKPAVISTIKCFIIRTREQGRKTHGHGVQRESEKTMEADLIGNTLNLVSWSRSAILFYLQISLPTGYQYNMITKHTSVYLKCEGINKTYI